MPKASSPSKNSRLRILLWVALSAALALGLWWLNATWRAAPSEGGAREPLNVVLIVIDTLRRDHVGAYGYERNTSPHIDAFFQHGSTFLNATSPSPCTVPAVLQVLTGARDFDIERPRLSELLRDRGYDTAAFVSQHQFGHRAAPKPAYRRGFELFDIQRESELGQHAMTTRDARQLTDPALAWLEARPADAAKPFFLWLHYFDPHDPYDPPERYQRFPMPVAGMSGDRRTRLQRAMDERLATADSATRARILAKPNPHAHFGDLFSPDEVTTLQSRYDAEILYTDAQIQRVFEALAQKQLLHQTLVVLTSDHGERLGEEARWAHCQSLHGYELNVPLMLRHPRRPGPHRARGAVSTLDIVPTVLSAVGIDPKPLRLDGVDLFAAQPDRIVHSVWTGGRAAQNDRWKLVLYTQPPERKAALFDLLADPNESSNVVSSHAEQRATLMRVMQSQAQRDAELLPRIDKTLEELRAIGYVQ